jgi:hypothetical protein
MAAERLLLLAKLLAVLTNPPLKGWQADAMGSRANRIQRHGTEWFTFLDYPEVKPDNNHASRPWRRVVVHRPVSGGALRDWGALAVAQMLSFWETVRLQGQSAIAQLYQLLCSCWSQSSGFTVLLNYLLVLGW